MHFGARGAHIQEINQLKTNMKKFATLLLCTLLSAVVFAQTASMLSMARGELAKRGLTEAEVRSKSCRRTNLFVKDPAIQSDYSLPQDYARSGYDRGHLAPAADMHWSDKAMAESFYMSNMSPQKPRFNRGIWSTLEQWVRDTAVAETNIVVVTGPVVSTNDLANTIGKRHVVVPGYFYKVIYDETPPVKMIAFLLPNEGSPLAISNFVVTVDSVEIATGLDFFSALPDETEDALESSVSVVDWKYLDRH